MDNQSLCRHVPGVYFSLRLMSHHWRLNSAKPDHDNQSSSGGSKHLEASLVKNGARLSAKHQLSWHGSEIDRRNSPIAKMDPSEPADGMQR